MMNDTMKAAQKSAVWSVVLLVLLAVLAYLPVLRGGFIFDDRVLITENHMVQASDGLYRFWFTAEAQPCYPLTWSLWWLEWHLWGNSATGYHVVNVLFHAVNVVLVWMILRRLKIPGAWLAAAVFAIHPVNVATVAWVSEQKNTLSMLFSALAILLYLRFDEEEGWHWYGLSLAAFLLALLSKTAVVMLPVVLLGCVWWRHGRVRRRNWLCSVPYFVASLILALVTIVQHQRHLGGTVVQTGGFAARLAGAGWAPWFYLSKTLLPVDLMVVYPKWEVDTSRWISYLPGIILVGLVVVFWWRRDSWGRPLLFGLGYFVVMFFPVLGFFDQAFYYYSWVADHWQYYSIVGVIALVVAAGVAVSRRMGGQGRSIGVLVSALVLLALGMATWRRARVYADSETLWRDNVAKNPNAWMAHNNLGCALQGVGKLGDAIAQYEQALRLKPDFGEAHYNLGITLAEAGRALEAIGHYEQALRIKPDYAAAHHNLAIALARVRRVPEAIGHYEQALRLKPDIAEAHYNLGVVLGQVGKIDDPNIAQAHNNLGVLLDQVGKINDAIGHYEQALRLKPDYAEAHNNLGIALARLGRGQEAIDHFEQALRIKPDYTAARNNLGAALAQAGRLQEATEQFALVLRNTPNDAEAHCNLGIALERAGKLKEAMAQYEQALRINAHMTEAQNRLTRLQTVP